MTNPRLLFIGLDAGDADLIDHWALEGRLPTIARMKSQGTWGRLATTADIFHVSAWPSIFTGTTADKHGLYHAYVTRPGHQGLLRPRPDQSPFPFLWRLLSDRGIRSVVMDAFLTCPLEPFHGVQMVDWGSWSHFWKPTIVPESLGQEISRQFGPYPADDHSKIGMTPVTDVAGFRQRLLSAVEHKTRVVKWLMQKEDWDFFLVVYGESHPAGHYLWHLHDKTYITHPPKLEVGLQHALRDIYVALDTAIGELIKTAGDDTTVLLVSGDGIAPNYSGSHLVPEILTRMGVLNGPASTADAPSGRTDKGTTGGDLLSALRNMVPERLRNAVSRRLLSREVQEQLSLRWKTAAIAWPRTRAFVIENANEGYIRVNLKGREPEGIVSPGAEYDALCGDLCRTARTMVNPATGKAAALSVYKTDELFDGPCLSHMPDVVITWNLEARVTTELLTEQHGLVRVNAPSCGIPPYYTGNHWPNAFAAATGPGIARGAVLEGRSILDLAPTILAQFGVEAPDFMDGRVLSELSAGHRTSDRDERRRDGSTPGRTNP